MKKRWDGKFLYYFGGIILSLFLCVGLVHMITGGESRDEKTELAESSQEKKSGEQPGEKEKENQKEKETDGKADKTVIRVLLRTVMLERYIPMFRFRRQEDSLWRGQRKSGRQRKVSL